MQQPQSSITQQQSSLSLTHQGYIVSVHIHTLDFEKNEQDIRWINC